MCPYKCAIRQVVTIIGVALQAIFLPTPKVKVMQLDPLMKYVVPYQSTLFPEGTVNVVDCQDTWLDMRGWDAGEAVKAVLVALRCRMVVRDGPPFTWQTWTFNSSVHFPCNVRRFILGVVLETKFGY